MVPQVFPTGTVENTINVAMNNTKKIFRGFHKLLLIIVLLLPMVLSAVAAAAEASDVRFRPVVQAREVAHPGNDNGDNRVSRWRELFSKVRDMSDIEKVKTVNGFFNELEYGEDSAVWGEGDYWSVPEEFLAKGVGDCEDFALSKYCTLVAMGIEENSLYLSCVSVMPGKTRHMVLCYAPAGERETMVLDNISLRMMPLSARTDLIPIYNFNREGLYIPQQRGKRGTPLGSSVPMAKWHDYLEKIEKSATAYRFPDMKRMVASTITGNVKASL